MALPPLGLELARRVLRMPPRKVLARLAPEQVSASTLADTLSRLLPDLKVSTGPVFLSPSLDSNATTGGGDQIRAMSSTDVSFRTHDVVFSGPADLVRRALALAYKFDVPRRQARITIKIVEINDSDTRNLGIDWLPEQPFSFGLSENPTTTTPAALVDGIRVGRFSHSPLVVNATLDALEAQGHARTLSNPTILLLDGERSFILSGQRYLYPKYTGKDQQGQSIYDVAEAKIGVYLQVGVQIGLDNDMILSLYPQVTSLGDSQTINGAQYPNINTSEEQTTVRAGNGEMLVLGGLLSDATTFNRSGVPFLSSIPLLGRLFSTDSKDKIKNELMLILTPELVDEVLPKDEVTISVSDPGRS